MVSRPLPPPDPTAIDGPMEEPAPFDVGNMLKEGGIGGFAQQIMPPLISGRSQAIQGARRAAQAPGGPNKLFSALKYAPQAAGEGANYLREYSGAADVRDIFSAITGKDIEYGVELGAAERIMYATPFLGLMVGISAGAVGYMAYKGAKGAGFTQPGGIQRAMQALAVGEAGELQLDPWARGDGIRIEMSDQPRATYKKSKAVVGETGDPTKMTLKEDVTEQLQGTTRGPDDKEALAGVAGTVDFQRTQTIDSSDIDALPSDIPTEGLHTTPGDATDVLNVNVMYLSGDMFPHIMAATSIDEIADGVRNVRPTMGRVQPLAVEPQGNLVAGITAWAQRLVTDTTSKWSRMQGLEPEEVVTAAARFETQRMAAFVESELFFGERGYAFMDSWDDFANGRIKVGSEEFDTMLGNLETMTRLLDSFGVTGVEGSLGPNFHNAGIHIDGNNKAHYIVSQHRELRPMTQPMLADGRGNTIEVADVNNLPDAPGYNYLIDGSGYYPLPSQAASYEGLYTQNLLRTLLIAFGDKDVPNSVKELNERGYDFYAGYAQVLADMYGAEFARSLDILAAETPEAHMERDSLPAMTETVMGTAPVHDVFDPETGNQVTHQNRSELGSEIEGAINGPSVTALARTMEAENARLGKPAPSGDELMAAVLENVRGVLGSRDWQGGNPPAARLKPDGAPLQYLKSQSTRRTVGAIDEGGFGARSPEAHGADVDAALNTLKQPGDMSTIPPDTGVFDPDVHGQFGRGESKVRFKVSKSGHVEIIGLSNHTGEKLRTMTLLPQTLNPEVFVETLNAIVADTHFFANVMGYRAGDVPHFDSATAYSAVVRAAVNVASTNPELFDYLGKVQSGAWYEWRNMGGVTGSPSGLVVWDDILRKVQGGIDSSVHNTALASTDNSLLLDPSTIVADSKAFFGTQHDKNILYFSDENGAVTVVAPVEYSGDLNGLYPLTESNSFGRKDDLYVYARVTPRPVLDAQAEAEAVLSLTTRVSGEESKVTGVSVFDAPSSMQYFDMPGVRRIRTAMPYDPTVAGTDWKQTLFKRMVEAAGIRGQWETAEPHTGRGSAYLDYHPDDYIRALTEDSMMTHAEAVEVVAHIFAGSDRFKMHNEPMDMTGQANYVLYDYGIDSSARFEPDLSQPYVSQPGVVKVFHGTKNSTMGPGELRGSKRGLYEAGVYLHTSKGFAETYAGVSQSKIPTFSTSTWLDAGPDNMGQVFEYEVDMGTVLDLDAPGGQAEYDRLTRQFGDDQPYTRGIYEEATPATGGDLGRTGSGMPGRHALLQAGYDTIVADRPARYLDRATQKHVVEDGREYILLADEIGDKNAASAQKTSLALVGGRRTLSSAGSLIPRPVDVVALPAKTPENIQDLAREAYAVLQAQEVEPTVKTWDDMPQQWQVAMKDVAQEAEGKQNLWFFPDSPEDMKKFAVLMQTDIMPWWSKVDPKGAGKIPNTPRSRWVPEFRDWDSRTIQVAGGGTGYRVKDLFGESVLDQAYYPGDRVELDHTNVSLNAAQSPVRMHAAQEYVFKDDIGVGGTHIVETAPGGHPHTQTVWYDDNFMPYVKGRTSDAVSATAGRVIEGKGAEQQLGNSAIVSTQGQASLSAKYPDRQVELVRTGDSILDQRIVLTNPETDKSVNRRPKYAAVYLPPSDGDFPADPRAGVPQIQFDHGEVVTYFTDNGFRQSTVSRMDITYAKDGQVTRVEVEGTDQQNGNLVKDLMIQGGVDMSRVTFIFKLVDEVPLK